MARRYPSRKDPDWPRLFLMTDERLGADLLPAVRRLPPRSGIVFRHYATSGAERHALFRKIRHVARARKHLLLLADTPAQVARWGADGIHGRARGRARPLSAPVHNMRELREAERARAAILFVSPVFPTQSHPGARCLGAQGFARLAGRTNKTVIALGGMDAARARRLSRMSRMHGWAAIDALGIASR